METNTFEIDYDLLCQSLKAWELEEPTNAHYQVLGANQLGSFSEFSARVGQVHVSTLSLHEWLGVNLHRWYFREHQQSVFMECDLE